jgi:cell division protein FtsN
MVEKQAEFFEDIHEEDHVLKGHRKKPVANIPISVLGMPTKVFFVVTIFFVVGLIFAYALGIEKGKKLSRYTVQKTTSEGTANDVIVIKVKDEDLLEHKTLMEPITEKPVLQKVPVVVAQEDLDLPYTVQIVAYKKQKSAEKKAKELRKNGEKVFVIPNRKRTWYQVCIGAFKTRQEAKVLARKLEKKYKGCFVREK